ncbi:uncharacterized protein LOC108093610 [Drosophila ficusphila]|uniref:uncharacterized protein LOC108093610 n=1 Tax=Drosophila ficusphila TaxID=30025 RepID=UPI001C893A19|nr:uncharacterized protein LOC108093610 [Drosophila ficusphila]
MNIGLTMNILKKSRVLNQNCLRDKVKELSPLLRNLDWPLSRDSVFRASWNYYASGCQERLSNTRRRIEQNARIMASDRRPKGPLPADLKLPFDESQLPPGADLDEQIYRELVSCFQNAEGPRSVKRTPLKRPKVYKSCDMGKFSTPEQWFSWKREEREVDEVLQKSKDPYVKEELSKKLQHLQQKLTQRRPLVVLPKPKEDKLPENDKVSKKVKSRKKFKVEPKASRQLSKEAVFQGKTSDKLGSTYSKSKTNVSKLQPTKLAKKYKVPSDLRKTSKKIGEKISKTYTNAPLRHQKSSSFSLKGKSSLLSNRSSNFSELRRVSHISETLNRLIAKHPSLESVMSSKPMKLSSKSKHIEKTDESTLRKEKLNINRDKYKRNPNQKKTKYSTENHKRNSLSLSQFSQNSDIKMWNENKKNKKIGRKEKLSEMPLSENNLTLPKTSDGDRISKEPIMKFVSTPKSSLIYPPKLEPYIHEILKATNPYDGSHLQFKEDQIANSDNEKDKGQEQINPNVQETLEETSVFGSVGRKSDKFGWQFKRHKIASSDNAKEKGRKKKLIYSKNFGSKIC